MANSKIKTEQELKARLDNLLKHMGYEWAITPCGPKLYMVDIYAKIQEDGDPMLGSQTLEILPKLGGCNNSVSVEDGRLRLLGLISLKGYRYVQKKKTEEKKE